MTIEQELAILKADQILHSRQIVELQRQIRELLEIIEALQNRMPERTFQQKYVQEGEVKCSTKR